MEKKVEHLYKQKDKLSAHDRDILAEPLEDRLKEKTHVLENWFEQTKPLIQECVRDYLALQAKGMTDIRNSFPRRQKEKTMKQMK